MGEGDKKDVGKGGERKSCTLSRHNRGPEYLALTRLRRKRNVNRKEKKRRRRRKDTWEREI